MAQTFFKPIKNAINNWWISLIVGIFFIIAGITCFVAPIATYATLTIIFSVSFLFAGISEIIFAISNKDQIDHWGWSLAYGLLTAIIGFYLVFNPVTSAEIFAYYIGFVVLFRSVSGISFALELRNHGVGDWGISLVFSVFALIFSLIILFNPSLAGLTAVIWVGMAITLLGFVAIFFSFQLKRLKNLNGKIPEELKNEFEAIKNKIKEYKNQN